MLCGGLQRLLIITVDCVAVFYLVEAHWLSHFFFLKKSSLSKPCQRVRLLYPI